MSLALSMANLAFEEGEVPVGAIVVHEGRVIGEGHNKVITNNSVSSHAEILAINNASQAIQNYRLKNCAIYVTLEPCAMCAGALAHSRVERVIYGAPDPKSGGIDHGARVFTHPQSHHRPEVIGGISERACASLLVDFFTQQRTKL